jgi:hypothetical protein
MSIGGAEKQLGRAIHSDPLVGLGRNDSLSRRRQADDRAQNSVVSQFEFSGRSRMDRIGAYSTGWRRKVCL